MRAVVYFFVSLCFLIFFFFKQKTAYEMRISDWSSDVCSSDLLQGRGSATRDEAIAAAYVAAKFEGFGLVHAPGMDSSFQTATIVRLRADGPARLAVHGKPIAAVPTVLSPQGNRVSGINVVARTADAAALPQRPEEHTST